LTNSEHSISVTSTGSVLTVNNVTSGMTNRRYRVTALGTSFSRPPALLQIHNSKIIFVKADASGTNNGSTWQNAFTNLQQAIAATDGCSSIWVARGIYTPTDTINGYKAFSLKSGVAIYGGFAGTETALNERNA